MFVCLSNCVFVCAYVILCVFVCLFVCMFVCVCSCVRSVHLNLIHYPPSWTFQSQRFTHMSLQCLSCVSTVACLKTFVVCVKLGVFPKEQDPFAYRVCLPNRSVCICQIVHVCVWECMCLLSLNGLVCLACSNGMLLHCLNLCWQNLFTVVTCYPGVAFLCPLPSPAHTHPSWGGWAVWVEGDRSPNPNLPQSRI